MRILLPQSIFYTPTLGGENRANRAWMEQLAHQGHECRVVAPAFGPQGPASYEAYLRELGALGIVPTPLSPFVDVYHLNGVEIHAATKRGALHAHVAQQIDEFEPTWVVVSSLDPGQLLLDTCARVSPSRVIYAAHTPQHFPFGPASVSPNPLATGLLQQVCAIIAIGRQTALYIRHYTGREPLVLHPPAYGRGPFPTYGNFEAGCVTMINPSAVKGISILASLAQEFRNLRFAALAGWATTAADRRLLTGMPNVGVWDPVRSINEILARTRMLLVPSLYREGFGLIAVEAMLRGIPVLASNYGGLVDAKLGVPYLLPIRPIERYTPRFDDRGFPVPVVPDQDMRPWIDAVRALSTDREQYLDLSEASREAAARFLAGVEIDSLGDILTCLAWNRSASGRVRNRHTSPRQTRDDGLRARLQEMSPRKRMLVARRLTDATVEKGGSP